MKHSVWKTILTQDEIQTISAPAGAEMLCASELMEAPCVWFLCDPDAEIKKRQIIVVGTGWIDIPQGKYIGTIFLADGQLVFHVFDGGEQ